MADYNSSLPVRTENDGDVVVKLGDGTIPSQYLEIDAAGKPSVKLNDGSGNTISSTGTSLDTNVTNGAGAAAVNIQDGGNSITVDAVNLDIRDLVFATDKVDVTGSDITATVTATDLDIRDLDATQDNVAISDGTDTLAVNADGSINSVVTATDLDIRNLVFATDKVDVTGSQVGVTNLPTTVDTNYGTVGASTLRSAAQIGNATGAADFNFGAVGAQTLRSAAQIGNATGAADFNAGATGVQTLRVHANQGLPNTVANSWPTLVTDGTDTMAVNTDGSINVVISDATPGTAINNYNTAAAVAANATSNHDYTVTALKTLSLNQIEAAGSGKMKIEVQIETGVASGVFATRWVQFNSTAETNMSIHIENPISVAAGVRVRIIRTNKDNQPQDLYSTISGYELP